MEAEVDVVGSVDATAVVYDDGVVWLLCRDGGCGGVACRRCWWCDGVDRDDGDVVVTAAFSPEKVRVRRKKSAGEDGGSPEKSAGKLFRRRRRAVAAAGK
ncbi:hypothetical protein Tco_1093411 [Tanacetum coccineum]|uniref:Uncharacterized protein n=1 Tax=Tanacetum coccineum TaxID=301880 RepID=A0ABQ5ICL4_9ASTR